MSLSEIAHRAAEHWKHRSDASFAETVSGIELGATAGPVLCLPQPEAAPEALKQALAREAAALLRGDWKLFGWRAVQVGTPPLWHRDPIHGVDLPPATLAHRLNHRTLPDGADARTVWEVNRWSEMVLLAMHGWVNGDREAVRVAIGWLEDWADQNPVGRGINWTSPLEAGLRLINFAWFEALVSELALRSPSEGKDGSDLLAALSRLAQRIVPAHAAWIWRYRSFGSSANNHLLGELVGLLHAVKRWPTLAKLAPADGLWRDIARCVLGQFATDGGNKEQALHYHLFAWEMGWHAARVMDVTDGPVIERLQKAAEFFVHMAHSHEQWEYGDNDDAQIVPLTLQRKSAVAEWRAWMKAALQGEALGYWAGPFTGTIKGDHSSGGWWLAPESGMAACERDGWKLRLDASPLGFGSMAAHGHCDALHLSIWDGAQALVIDPGTGGYFNEKQWRTELADWTSHNGPIPSSGFGAPHRAGTFLWMDSHPIPALAIKEGSAQARFTHEGCSFSRKVDLDSAGVAVTDQEAKGRAFSVTWLLAPDCEVQTVEDGAGIGVEIVCGDSRWRVVFSSLSEQTPIVTQGKATVSPAFGMRREACMLKVTSSSGALCSLWQRA